jgi:hypothetical protein
VRAIARRDSLIVVWLTVIACGCGGAGEGPAANPLPEVDPAVLSADPEATQALQDAVTEAINSTTNRFKPLDYEYDEDLLAKLDQIEAHLSGKPDAPAPRFLPRLDPEEELEHYREVIKRWEAKTGKNLRKLIDPLKAEVAEFKPGETTHPEFHKRFSAAFDDFIPIEVEEMRERRNQALRAEAETAFASYRESHPKLVQYFESQLDQPQYRVPVEP